MGAENLLFPEMKAGPPGFIYRENFVTEEEERTLAASLGELDLRPFEFHGYLGNRRWRASAWNTITSAGLWSRPARCRRF